MREGDRDVCVCVRMCVDNLAGLRLFFNGLERVTATIARSHASVRSLLQNVQKKNDLQLLSMFFVVTALFRV